MSGGPAGGPGGRGWSPLHFRPPSPYAPSPPPRLGSPAMNMFGNRIPYGVPCPRPRWPTPMSPIPRGVSPPPVPLGPRPFRLPMHPVSTVGCILKILYSISLLPCVKYRFNGHHAARKIECYALARRIEHCTLVPITV